MTRYYYLYCFIVFVTSSKGAKIYIIDNPEEKFERNPVNIIHKNIESNSYPLSDIENGKPLEDVFKNHFKLLLNRKNIKKTTCDRLFGNIIGTKLQKLQCYYLNRDKNKRFPKYHSHSESGERPIYNYPKLVSNYVQKDKQPFEDLTRGYDHIIQFTDDYIDVQDLGDPIYERNLPKDYYDYLFDLSQSIYLMDNTQTTKCPLAGRHSRNTKINSVVPKYNHALNKFASEKSSGGSDDSSEMKKTQLK